MGKHGWIERLRMMVKTIFVSIFFGLAFSIMSDRIHDLIFKFYLTDVKQIIRVKYGINCPTIGNDNI